VSVDVFGDLAFLNAFMGSPREVRLRRQGFREEFLGIARRLFDRRFFHGRYLGFAGCYLGGFLGHLRLLWFVFRVRLS